MEWTYSSEKNGAPLWASAIGNPSTRHTSEGKNMTADWLNQNSQGRKGRVTATLWKPFQGKVGVSTLIKEGFGYRFIAFALKGMIDLPFQVCGANGVPVPNVSSRTENSQSATNLPTTPFEKGYSNRGKNPLGQKSILGGLGVRGKLYTNLVKGLSLFLIIALSGNTRGHLFGAFDNDLAMKSFHQGAEHSRTKQYEKAIVEYTKAIELNPKMAVAYAGRGLANINLGHFEKAITDCTKAIELDPKDALVYFNRGDAYYDIKQYEKALADYTKAIELNPKQANAYTNRGFANRNLGQLEKAIADSTKAIELDPKQANAYTNRGHSLLILGKIKEAEADFAKAKMLKGEK